MSFDPLLLRHHRWGESIVRAFRPDVIHITGPSDVGILGAWLADRLAIPLVASWHTNLHEFGARRLDKLISFMPVDWRHPVTTAAERGILFSCGRFYRLARVLLAPNDELVEMLARRTGRPAFLMQRGVDTTLYNPARRKRQDGPFVFGYVGRVTPEKNVRLLVDLDRALESAWARRTTGSASSGRGSEVEWLQQNLRRAEFPGVLRGDALADAYADLDAFVFPSHTDTFGNVILEASASGVPCVVTASGGPKFLVRNGVSGYVAENDGQLVTHAVSLVRHRGLHAAMRVKAREFAQTMSWDSVFERVYAAYETALVDVRPRMTA